MSNSETEHPSSTSKDLRESTNKKQRAKKRWKMISSISEGEEEEEEEEEGEEKEEEEEEEKEPHHRATISNMSAEELSEDEEEGAIRPGDDSLADDNLALAEVGDDDGDSVDTDSSSEVPGAETCAICLGRMRGEVGSPEACEHTFCLICILEWAKTNPSCPQDRKAFTKVLVRLTLGTEEVDRKVAIKKQESELVLIPETDNPTYCEVCHECDREDRLLLCDGCDLGYHLECLDPPLDQVPVEEWFCPGCTSANLPSTVRARQTPQDESSTSRERPRRQPSSSQRPRLIPRTRATERVRDRIIRKRREKRKKRRLKRKRKIENGEIDDPRPPVDCKERLMFFGSINNEVPAEDVNDTFADHLLAGVSDWTNSRNPAVRKNDAVKILRDAAFTPSTSYAGKASMAVINRINNQAEETREDDVLSSILENQSIVLTTSKKLSLTSDRKFKKEGEASDTESFSLKQEESSLMTEPLPSRRSTQKGDEERSTSQEDERKHSSPPRRTPHYSFYHHSSYSHNSRYGHSSRGFEFNRRTLREGGEFREERIQKEEKTSGTVHQSPLEDRRRSPPRMSYQRQMPSHQFKNQRNALPNNRNRDPHGHWDERQKSQRSQPWKDFGHKQNPSSDTRWGRRGRESSGSSSKEHSNQERYGRNGKDSSKEDSSYKSHRPSSDKRDSSPPLGVHDKYPRRNEDGDDHYSQREEDRCRKEERKYHHQYHQRDHCHHRGYRSSYRTEKESPSSRSSYQSRSYSKSPVRSRSPARSRSRSRSHSRLRETHSRDHKDAKRRKNGHQHSSDNNISAFKAMKSPVSCEGTLNDSQQLGDNRVTTGNGCGSDIMCSPHFSKFHEPSKESSSEIPDGTPEDKFKEAKSRTIKNEIKEQKSTLAEGSLKVPGKVKREREDIKSDNTYCDSDVTDQKHVPEKLNLRKAEYRILGKEKKGSDFDVKTEHNLLNDAKSISFSVQNSCKGDQKGDKLCEVAGGADSRKDESGSDTFALQSIDYSNCINKEEQQRKIEVAFKEENQPERKKRKKFLSGFYGRILEYTPEVELSHWDENPSEDAASPFKVIKKCDVGESDKGISLPFSLQRLLPGEENIAGESDDRINTTMEENLKHKLNSDNKHEEGKNLEILNSKGYEILKSERVGLDTVNKEQENMSENKHYKKKLGHKTLKVDTKPPDNKTNDSVSPSSCLSTIPRSKSKEKPTGKTTMESQSQRNVKQEKTHSTSQTCDQPSMKSHDHNHRKESAGKTEDFQNIFGDISDLSDTDFDDDERNKKILKSSSVIEKSSVKQKDPQETNDKFIHGTQRERTRKGEHEKKILKGDEHPTKSQKLEGTVTSGMKFPQKGNTKSKNWGKGTKDAKPNKGYVLDLFGDTSDSDDADNVEIEKNKLPEKLLNPALLKGDSAHRKGRETTDTHKGKERRPEKETSFHRKSSEPSKLFSDSLKHDMVDKKGREAINSHKGENRKSEKKSSPHRKLLEEVPKGESVSRKEKEVTNTHNRKEKRSEKETSPHKKSSQEATSVLLKDDFFQRKQGESTNVFKGKDIKSEKETSLHRKSLEEPAKSLPDSRKEVLENHKERNIKFEKESPQHKKISENPSKSFLESLECGLNHSEESEAAVSHKRKDKKSEREASPHKKSSEEPSISTSESLKHDSLYWKEKKVSDSQKEKDLKSQKESSPSKKSSGEVSKSSSELFEFESSHRKAREVTDSYKRHDRKPEQKTSSHGKLEESPKINSDTGKIREATDKYEEHKDECPQEKPGKVLEKLLKVEQPKSDTGTDKVREATNDHEGQKDGYSQQTQKKMSEKPGKVAASETRDEHIDHKKTTELKDIPRGQPERDKRLFHTEDYSKRKSGCSSHEDGDPSNRKKRKSSSNPGGKIQRDKDPVNKTESKSLVVAASSLQSTSHSSDRREKKDSGDSHAKQVKASLELKVVTEVKKWLDPYYRDKSITKEEYKEIVAKCVSKVVSAECGDVIESEKMHSLVAGYVKLYRHRRAKLQALPSS